nr:amidohydrolase family protein [Pseudomonas sp.]
MEFIDPHHHLWDTTRNRYPFLQGPMHDRGWGDWSALRESYLVENLLKDAEGLNLAKSVHVQANYDPSDPVGETMWLDEVAAQATSMGFPHGIVAFADFSRDDVTSVMEGHARSPRMRGIRQVLNRHPDPKLNRAEHDWLSDPTWQRNFGLLERFGWSFDAQVYYQQMEQLALLAQRYPNIQFILDHAGMPVERDETGLAGWRSGMRRLAECPNVAVKLSGYGMVDPGWTIDSIRPFIREPIEWFGIERAMFASNFPVDKLMSTYARLWSAYEDVVADFSESEKRKLFYSNAERVYRL